MSRIGNFSSTRNHVDVTGNNAANRYIGYIGTCKGTTTTTDRTFLVRVGGLRLDGHRIAIAVSQLRVENKTSISSDRLIITTIIQQHKPRAQKPADITTDAVSICCTANLYISD